jgi:hypothetical protein
MVISSHPGTSRHLCECCRGVFWSKMRSRLLHIQKRAPLTLQAARPPARALEWSSRCMVRVPKSESDRVQLISSRVAPAVKEVENGSDRHV